MPEQPKERADAVPLEQQSPAKRGPLRTAWGVVWAILRQRCPRCQKGRLFRGVFAMNDPCPVCGLLFQREEGYFLGAMYVTYVFAAVFLGAGFFLARWLLPGWNDFLVLNGLCLLYLPFTPALFRYSRTVWIHFERAICPSDVSAGPFEKARVKKLAAQAAHEALRRDDASKGGSAAAP